MNAFLPLLNRQVIIPTGTRVYAIGDIHGYPDHLRGILNAAQTDLDAHPLAPNQDYRFVFLGDYIDRGPDSKKVVDILVGLEKDNPHYIFLEGNHEKDFVDVLKLLSGDATVTQQWAEQTVIANMRTYKSYGVDIKYRDAWELPEIKPLLEAVPKEHKIFLQDLPRSALMGRYLFVHNPDHAIGDPAYWTPPVRAVAEAYIWNQKRSAPLAMDHPARHQIIVHGHRAKSWGAPPENHVHRIGLNDYSDDDSHRVVGAVLETGRRPRFLSYTSKLECRI